MIRLLSILIILSAITSCTKKAQKEEVIDSERLGQMLIVGFRGIEIDQKHPLVKDLKEFNLGGVILYDYDYELESFGRNTESQDQLLKLSSDLIANAPISPIIAVHHDGSFQSPLSSLYDDGDTLEEDFLQDSSSTVSYSRKYAQEFRVLSLNTNFNPRLDLQTPTTNAPNPEIISSNPEVVTQQAGYILDEYDKELLFSVPKYFPGYSSDYHPTDSTNDVTDVWTDDFLHPYRDLLSSDREIWGIMTAHSFNAHIDSVWPGTLSEKTITGLLRDSLGFEGVILSDDLQKPIITSKYSLETAIQQAINAGVDILVLGNNHTYDEQIAEKAIGIIQQLLREGKIEKERVEASLARIDSLKINVIEGLCSCMNF
ncbi:glycoside hydrolase family 3 N-terminal domain-containing protein [Gracilimonas sp. BCB1]|uniref:glycoside hydrolase family 3 N-terminal domain-containing protein n=1 Tax=Gracilimonas sp. BCB1 TaxID=3152362 RepID=UPI0032D91524